MFVLRKLANVFLSAIVIAALPFACQAQASGPRAELGPQVTEPHPDFGTVDSKHYVNGYFGFSYAYPQGWQANAVQSTAGAPSGTGQYALFTANPSVSAAADMRYVTIVADPLPKNATPKAFLDGALKTFGAPESGFQILRSDQHYNFGGKQFYRIDLESKPSPGAPTVYQTQVFVVVPNYAVTFSFMAGNPKDIDALVHSMESVSFDTAAAPAHGTATEAKSQAR
jgi:hypothetical protein